MYNEKNNKQIKQQMLAIGIQVCSRTFVCNFRIWGDPSFCFSKEAFQIFQTLMQQCFRWQTCFFSEISSSHFYQSDSKRSHRLFYSVFRMNWISFNQHWSFKFMCLWKLYLFYTYCMSARTTGILVEDVKNTTTTTTTTGKLAATCLLANNEQ